MSDRTDKTNPLVPLTVNGQPRGPVSRRRAIQWVVGAAAAAALPTATGCTSGKPRQTPTQSAATPPGAHEEGRNIIPQEQAAQIPDADVKGGYGFDPKLVKTYKPGEVWPLTMTDAQKTAAAALADVILPADPYGPAASGVGVVEMLDEWVSAPYPQQRADRPVILEGLAWLDAEAQKRFGKGKSFAGLSDREKRAICDDVCYEAKARREFRTPARFFGRFRSLAAGAYYATPAGWKAIGYVGNVALERFDGPPQEVLDRLGVTQTVQ